MRDAKIYLQCPILILILNNEGKQFQPDSNIYERQLSSQKSIIYCDGSWISPCNLAPGSSLIQAQRTQRRRRPFGREYNTQDRINDTIVSCRTKHLLCILMPRKTTFRFQFSALKMVQEKQHNLLQPEDAIQETVPRNASKCQFD